MRVIGIGHLLFALGLAGLGVLSLFSGDFPYVWEPVPLWVPGREVLAHLSGLLLLACGIALLIKRTAGPAASVLAVYLLGWVLVLQAPRAAHDPGNMGMWLGVAESSVLFSGGWILAALLAGPQTRARMPFLTGEGAMRIARILFGLACLPLGLSHFVYSAGTAGMIPAWIPAHLGFAYFTGLCHFAAGLGVLLGVFPRLAATLEAVMISLFVLLLHIPGAAAEPTSRMQWTMVFVATALAGAVWANAASLKETAWSWSRWSPQRPSLAVVRPQKQT
jgi:uncharacterized membrane protein YphA (DoxX/SURF4 family)